MLIWQQPHPFYFAELEYKAFPNKATLAKWSRVLEETANFMVSFAFWNESSGVFDLGPPLHGMGENSNASNTLNPPFELAYWRFGLDIAAKWFGRQNRVVPEKITKVYRNLAPFPIQNRTYVSFEGVHQMWSDRRMTYDHPAAIGINGFLPPDERVDKQVFNNTLNAVLQTWNLTKSYGWDFPMLAMAKLRVGDVKTAVDLLLDLNFAFDDVGMPQGGSRARTPYFPSSSGLLMATAMLADGWEGRARTTLAERLELFQRGFRTWFMMTELESDSFECIRRMNWVFVLEIWPDPLEVSRT
jgi:hypothetical protein